MLRKFANLSEANHLYVNTRRIGQSRQVEYDLLETTNVQRRDQMRNTNPCQIIGLVLFGWGIAAMVVADLGAGTGANLRHLAGRLGPFDLAYLHLTQLLDLAVAGTSATGGTVWPRPLGYCSEASTGTPNLWAISISQRERSIRVI